MIDSLPELLLGGAGLALGLVAWLRRRWVRLRSLQIVRDTQGLSVIVRTNHADRPDRGT
ncbi:hypothetical protein GCM10012287_56390 [Streptomyces daqingensis]|uniref:Uncharacterized protein n=1 Tax=Streptomyces daqingensis TaxID=1472640 RepID=A0ABQ2MUT9_9ACTN|nr:hypothetical protein GCM10012287_56390 [Streptomyces daqingensis]